MISEGPELIAEVADLSTRGGRVDSRRWRARIYYVGGDRFVSILQHLLTIRAPLQSMRALFLLRHSSGPLPRCLLTGVRAPRRPLVHGGPRSSDPRDEGQRRHDRHNRRLPRERVGGRHARQAPQRAPSERALTYMIRARGGGGLYARGLISSRRSTVRVGTILTALIGCMC